MIFVTNKMSSKVSDNNAGKCVSCALLNSYVFNEHHLAESYSDRL